MLAGPAEPNIVPAIAVTVDPVDASSPERQDQDIAAGPTMRQAEEAPRQLPKERQAEKTEQPPPQQQQADITLLRETPKEIETPKPQVQPLAPETRAPPKTEHIGQFTQASANAYNALVFGHLQRFKRYPSAAHGAAGTVVVQFALDRDGNVVTSVVTKSSGNNALDREAIETLRRASPFPVFPPPSRACGTAFSRRLASRADVPLLLFRLIE